ncbi:MAG TPA: D-ornithine 4,5-aminomutase subunit OraS [Anaerolineaceae bacterium]|nr:ornithine aminomutase [Chloroflexota bacterium]HNY84595.1 D-ornithine 4,5-aminomutase subunit OraS [Anaerolineaceae bacterium]
MTDDRFKKFEERHARLKELSDAELKARFWELCDQVVTPIAELARTHTSPSIERSVLLRMGIDSQSALGVVNHIHQAGLLGKGAGHVLLKLADKHQVDVVKAAAMVLEDKEVLQGLFGEVAA